MTLVVQLSVHKLFIIFIITVYDWLVIKQNRVVWVLLPWCVTWNCSYFLLASSYSPLHTIHLYSQTMTKAFFREKIWISRNGAKTPLHTVRHRQQFSRIWISSSEPRKIAFEFRPETAPSSEDGAERRMKNLFAKCQRKCSTHYSCFVAIFRYCSR